VQPEGVRAGEKKVQDILDKLRKSWRGRFAEPAFVYSSVAFFNSLCSCLNSYTGNTKVLRKANDAAGIGHLRSHSLRHTYRTWLDSVGTSVGVQQKLMRHADIRTTTNIYGDAGTSDMREAHGKIVGLALTGMETE